MSLKKIEQVKRDKGFKLWDLLIYGVIIVIAAVLFILVFTFRDTDPLTGIRIYVGGNTVFEYEFGGSPQVYSDAIEVKDDGAGLTVTIRSDDGGLNVLYINKSAKTAKMTQANCNGHQCLYLKINDNNDFISCEPHRIKVEPFKKDLNNPDIIM